MRITSKGQVTIPRDIREKAGLMPNTEVKFDYDGRTVRIRRAARPKDLHRGQRLVEQLRGGGDIKMTTDEIMKLWRGK